MSAKSKRNKRRDRVLRRVVAKTQSPRERYAEFIDAVNKTVFFGARAMPMDEAMWPYSTQLPGLFEHPAYGTQVNTVVSEYRPGDLRGAPKAASV